MLEVRPEGGYFAASVVAHGIGVLSAYLALQLFRATDTPPAGRHLPPPRLLASLAAVALTLLGQSAVGVDHRLAVWTALLVTFGLFRGTRREALALAAAVVFVGLVGGRGG